MSEKIERYLKQLKLGGLARDWASVTFTSKEDYLINLLELELREREINRINRLVKTAGFNVIKTLDDFQWNPNINIPNGIDRQEIETFAFIPKKENLILMGAVGTGKTHLASAIGLAACRSGRKVRFFTAAGLANILLEKNQKGTINNFLGMLKKVELMIIDEIGFVPLHKDAAQLLFQVISDCYERRSLIITSNLEFSQWNTIFGDNRLTAALVDRLVHHSHIMVFSGESFRLSQSMKRQKISK
ncbi:IS21-like element helper ATPase IstB [Tyzzerella sp. OttesenSCG-928-J15]|nr:IS21-like element helper ATPase IstB [Tyzzerella sp. OttesenSCG-928-J15]